MRAGTVGTALEVCAALAVLALFSPHAASAALTYVEGNNESTAAVQREGAIANCPVDTFATGGGAYSSGAFGAVAIQGTFPLSATQWVEYTDVYSGSQTHRAFVICDATEPAMRSVERSIPADSARTVRLDCPAGENLYGGGYYAATFVGTVGDQGVRSSRPFDDNDSDSDRDDGWEVTSFNLQSSSRPLEVYALCGPKHSSTHVGTREASATSQRFVSKRCPSDDRVTGGGAHISGPGPNTWISSLYPRDGGDADSKPDDGWAAYLENDTNKDRQVKSYVVCR